MVGSLHEDGLRSFHSDSKLCRTGNAKNIVPCYNGRERFLLQENVYTGTGFLFFDDSGDLITGNSGNILVFVPLQHRKSQPMKRTVLVIDDEVDFCLLVKNYLANRNYDVYTAHTLSKGLQLLDEKKPDVLLIDNNLPDGFGWKEAPGIQKKFPDLKITLISAFESAFLVTDTGGVAFRVLEKPVTLSNIEKYL